MPSLLDLIKTASGDALNASNPVNILFGEVLTVNPLSVKVDQRFTLPADFLIVPESLIRYEVDLKHMHQYTDDGSPNNTSEALTSKIVIRSGLAAGNKVLMLRVQGGQRYVVLDKVVTGS
ncbi:Protein of unknown function (DUF2577) [Desulfitobacterium dehalogenans ATCC 51507]|uniref:DUF2577 domain-containing protein n=1 Tax=Desulfitobacterium dehalogenans (strain ATCC 51507 / DSM 9161 / JW/IU-DC1) TaxID=756499 RepID=I4A6E8_DESDJ|nr:DUF2577 domain-containing protein [Desulfitobacterium dehalogenans]AFL99532.1 Protein of unknown function (DUF2577) [Desulfitobacterium dehalogenans ATCC 51507]